MHLTVCHIFLIFPLLNTSILLRGQSILNVVFLSSFKIRSYGLLLLCNSQLESLKNYSWHYSSYVKEIEVILKSVVVMSCFSSGTGNDNLEKRIFNYSILIMNKPQLKSLLIRYNTARNLELKTLVFPLY